MGLGDKVRQTITDALSDATDSVRDRVTDMIFNAGLGVMERVEGELAGMETGIIDEVLANPDVPELQKSILRQVKSPTSPAPLLVAAGIAFFIAQGSISSLLAELNKRAIQRIKQTLLADIPEPTQAIMAAWRQALSADDRDDILAKHGFPAAYRAVLEAVTRPLVGWNELRQLVLRGELTQPEFEAKMASWGWTADDIDGLQKLHLLIPGVSDLVRMAVREAFSTQIIEEFQLHADFPPEFGKWAAAQGLSDFWAKAYWAAHWELPSLTQAFEMFHRSVIDRDTLDLLLRTQDVMPYWRDKLTQIAYNPLTRVDVRRMFGQGVLDRAGVKRAYLDIGYSEANAELMTEFTVKFQAGSDRELTKSDIIGSYKRGTIKRDEALTMLEEIDYDEEEAEFLLAQADAGLSQAGRDLTIENYKSLYLRKVLTQPETTAALTTEGFDAREIELLYKLWAPEAEIKDRLPSLANLEDWYSSGIIDLATWRREMEAQRYDKRYIDWYERALTGTAAAASEKELSLGTYKALYQSRIITELQLREALRSLRYGDDEVALLVKLWAPTAEAKGRDLSLSDLKAAYLRGINTEAATRSAVTALGFDSKETELLIKLWQPVVKERTTRPSRTDLEKFLKAGVLTLRAWREEMAALGYPDRYIAMYEDVISG